MSGAQTEESQVLLNPDAQIQYKVRYYSLPVAFCFTVNYVIGVGALGIPIAFRQAGWILSLIVLIIVAIISVITIGWIIEAISWAHDDCSVVHKKFEIVELAEMYLGRKGKIAFQVSLLFLMYTGLWAYSAVFVTSVIGLIGLEKWAICLIFAAMVVPLSFLDFSEQKIIQIALTVMRAGTFALMIISTIIALWTDPKDVGPTSDHKAPYIANQTFIAFSGIGSIFTTGLFSLLFQHSVPGLFHFIQPSKKSKALRVFTFAIIACLSLYLLLAMLTNLYFGADILSSVNLNWKSFSYGYEIVPAWANVISKTIILFPALDTLSVFPLIAITLGNNMLHSISSLTYFSERSERLKRSISRFLASFPPIVGVLLIENLEVILQISGIFAIYVALINPSLTIFAARKQIEAKKIDLKSNPYYYSYGTKPLVFIVIALGIIAITFVLVNLFL